MNKEAFILTIAVGNDTMNSPQHVADALRKLANELSELPRWRNLWAVAIHDTNGNNVGTAELL